MAVSISVKYCSLDGERAFLGDGWGAYDVGGPYLITSSGRIDIPNLLLQSRSEMALYLTFAVSNRIGSDSLEVVVKHNTCTYGTTIHRNELAEIAITNLQETNEVSCSLSVQALVIEQKGFRTVMRSALDMLSIEALLLEPCPKGPPQVA